MGEADGRPSAEEYRPWTADEVREFLELRCGLSASNKTPAWVVQTHDEVLGCWKKQIESGELKVPFDVVHIDAHADLAMGAGAMCHVTVRTNLLHEPVQERPNQDLQAARLCEGNYLVFAIAFRWIRSLTYICHPQTQDDVPNWLTRTRNDNSTVIELQQFRREDARDLLMSADGHLLEPVSVEPRVPFVKIPLPDMPQDGPFDYAYLSISPSYTPPEAETLVSDVFADYLAFSRAP